MQQTGNDQRGTRRAGREIISISLPIELYENLSFLCRTQSLNRSAVISSAIAEYISKWKTVKMEDDNGRI